MGAMRFCWLGIGVLVTGLAWSSDCHLSELGTLPVEMIGLRATTMVKINGTDKRFMLDTGAFFNAMSHANADALKVKTWPAPFGFYISGVGGDANAEIGGVKEFGIIGITLHDVEFIVGGSSTCSR